MRSDAKGRDRERELAPSPRKKILEAVSRVHLQKGPPTRKAGSIKENETAAKKIDAMTTTTMVSSFLPPRRRRSLKF